jgi:nitrogen fixation protein FixH
VKINWGTGIALSIIIFTLISLAFIYFAFNQEVNLVRDDYYEAELEYNEKMETLNRTANLKDNVRVSLDNKNLSIQFPQEFDWGKIKGKVLLYRPSDRRLDRSYDIALDSTYIQLIKKDLLSPGMWKVQINWSIDAINYFNEEIIMVN